MGHVLHEVAFAAAAEWPARGKGGEREDQCAVNPLSQKLFPRGEGAGSLVHVLCTVGDLPLGAGGGIWPGEHWVHELWPFKLEYDPGLHPVQLTALSSAPNLPVVG